MNAFTIYPTRHTNSRLDRCRILELQLAYARGTTRQHQTRELDIKVQITADTCRLLPRSRLPVSNCIMKTIKDHYLVGRGSTRLVYLILILNYSRPCNSHIVDLWRPCYTSLTTLTIDSVPCFWYKAHQD